MDVHVTGSTSFEAPTLRKELAKNRYDSSHVAVVGNMYPIGRLASTSTW